MNAKKLFTVLILTALIAAGTALASINFNPGQWEFTTKTEIKGVPGMNVPANTHVQCITQEDLVPMTETTSHDCRITDVSVKGDTVSWKIICDGRSGAMEGTGKVTYHGDSMEGTMEMIMKDTDMKIINRITGKRIGECNGQAVTSSTQTAPNSKEEPSEVEKNLTKDTKDVGKAARDEVKDGTTKKVRKGVRKLFDKVFD